LFSPPFGEWIIDEGMLYFDGYSSLLLTLTPNPSPQGRGETKFKNSVVYFPHLESGLLTRACYALMRTAPFFCPSPPTPLPKGEGGQNSKILLFPPLLLEEGVRG